MATATLVTGIDATGLAVLTALQAKRSFSIQNVGTVALTVYYNATGAGDPEIALGAGTVNDDGTGGFLAEDTYHGPVWVKCPATGGRALVGYL